jgi:beta-galactosidase
MNIFVSNLRSWENPELTSLNKLPPRATFYPFASAKQARSREREQSPFFQSFDGQWQFRLEPTPTDALALIKTRPIAESAAWGTITALGNWELQSHGYPHYTNLQMPWPHQHVHWLPPHRSQ